MHTTEKLVFGDKRGFNIFLVGLAPVFLMTEKAVHSVDIMLICLIFYKKLY